MLLWASGSEFAQLAVTMNADRERTLRVGPWYASFELFTAQEMDRLANIEVQPGTQSAEDPNRYAGEWRIF